jgi:subtilase family serine protease
VRKKVAVILGFLCIFVLGGAFTSIRFFQSAHAEARFQPKEVSSLPSLLKASQLVGSDTSNRTLSMNIGLELRNQDQLSALLAGLYDPSSPTYHQYLTSDQFAQRFGPTPDQRQAVIDYLTQKGFTVTQVYPTLIDFSGSESLAESAFGVSINDYQTFNGFDFFANATQPTLPAYLASDVVSISGLDSANQYYHPPILSHSQPAANPGAASNCPASGASGGGSGGGGIFGGGTQVAYIPSQLSTAYNYDGLHSAGLQGEGQTAGVFELDGYSQSDIQAYAQCFGGGSVPLQNVVLDGFNGQPGAGAIEVELDIEMIISQAPHLSKLLVYEAPNTTQGYNDEFARIVQDRTPVVSVSWGDCETNIGQSEATQENQFFQQAAAQGQTILVAAGDSGSSSCFQGLSGGSFDFSLNADDPAAQPYVTGVGGTNLTINSGNSYASETVWNGGFLGGAGGGGISQFWKQPSWQTGPGVQNSYSNGMRETPDVSLDADPATGYPTYCTAGSSCTSSGGIFGGGTSGGWITVGGTSAAAPMWAAMVALANEMAAKEGKGPMGFLNPAIYKIASGSRYSSDFHDITPPSDPTLPSNNDEIGFNGGAYPVTQGYDMATGWGSFDAAKLAADLVAVG